MTSDPIYVGGLDDAAALIVRGHQLDYVAHINGRLRFVFLPDQCIADDYMNYRRYRLPVDARRLVDAIDGLREALLSTQPDENGGSRP